jgi:hypothetical protein
VFSDTSQEVVALLDASDAHLVADHSRLDVLLGAGEKDIEEWATLTLQVSMYYVLYILCTIYTIYSIYTIICTM